MTYHRIGQDQESLLIKTTRMDCRHLENKRKEKEHVLVTIDIQFKKCLPKVTSKQQVHDYCNAASIGMQPIPMFLWISCIDDFHFVITINLYLHKMFLFIAALQQQLKTYLLTITYRVVFDDSCHPHSLHRSML